MSYKKIIPLFFFLSLASTSVAFAEFNIFSKEASLIWWISIPIIVITGVVLFRAMRARKEMQVIEEMLQTEGEASEIPADARRKIIETAVRTGSGEKGVQAITKVFEEETQQIITNFKKEYTQKVKVVIDEKNREIEDVKKEATETKVKYVEAEQKYEKVDAEKKTTEAVVRSISDGLVVVNQKGEVLLMNPAAEKILGNTKEKKVGKSIFDDLSEEILVSFTKQGSNAGERMVEIKSRDENVKKVIRSSSAVIQNENGQTVGMVNILTDITKQKELEEMKRQFISNITHELRTPIVAMKQALTLLLSESTGALNATQIKFLGIASRNLMQLSQIVEDVLDVEKIESGRMEVKPKATSMTKLCNDVCDSLEPWARSKDIQLVREVDPNLPEMMVDPDKITQVMNNLIGNAVKFTPKGGKITVSASLWLDGATAQISVADTGCGIAKENIPKLFRRFAQFGDHAGTVGTGLGLCIVKDLVEKHGGQIFVESEDKKGSRFYFTLPVKRV